MADFLSEFRAYTAEAPTRPEYKHPGQEVAGYFMGTYINLDIIKGGRIHLSEIRVKRPDRLRGNGSKALDWLVNLAAQFGMTVEGIAESFDGGTLTDEQIRDWYERHGVR